MKLPRFTIRSLLLAVLSIAVAVAALRASTDSWDSGVLGLALLTLLTATILAVHRTGRRRAHWLGFSLFGWVYFGASMLPPIEARLPTTKGLAYLNSKLPRQEWAAPTLYRLLDLGFPVQSASPPPVSPDLTKAGPKDWAFTWMLTGSALPGSDGTAENFVRIGHSLLALVIALLGGRLSVWLYDRDHVGMAGGARP